MEIKCSFPAQGLAGTVKNSDLVFFERGSQTFAHTKRHPANPQTSDQLKVRAYLSVSSKAWGVTLTAPQRAAWNAYAAADVGYSGSGYDLFVGCNFYRQLLGLAVVAPAPTVSRPPPITSCVNGDAGAVTDLVFNCVHGVATADIALYAVATRYTPPVPSQQVWHQKKGNLRYCAHIAAASIPTLVATGGEINIPNCQFTMGDGLKFGLEVCIVEKATGLASYKWWSNHMNWSLG